jgi:hypothetical protein
VSIAAMTREAEARERVLSEIADHELTVLHDDGLYRHLRFMAPGSSFYWFDLVTWPGVLVINGDCGTFTFSRVRDMLEFFESDAGQINPHYWAQKLRGPTDGTRSAQTYDPETFERRLRAWARDATGKWGEHEEVYPHLLLGALEREVFRCPWWAEWGTYDTEQDAHALLAELAEADVVGSETWEWDLRDWHWQFLWCCWAIVEGIKRYRGAVALEDKR